MTSKKHAIFVINESDKGKSYRHRARVAFENKGGSFTFKLDVLQHPKFQFGEERPFAENTTSK